VFLCDAFLPTLLVLYPPLKALAAIADQNDREYFALLSKRERETLVAILKKLVRAHGLRTLPTE
jgi:hypothetical protein